MDRQKERVKSELRRASRNRSRDPQRFSSLLLSYLEAPETPARLASLEFLKDRLPGEFLDEILILLLDSDPQIKGLAKETLLAEEEKIASLAREALVSGEKRRQLAALEILKARPDAISPETLRILIPTASEAMLDAFPEVLAKMTTGSGDPFVQTLLVSRDPHERMVGVEMLGLYGDPRLIDRVFPFFADPDEKVRRQALFVAVKIGAEGLPVLQRELFESPISLLQQGILQVIEGLKEPSSVPVLLAFLRTPIEEELRRRVIAALRIFDSVAEPFLIEALAKEKEPLRVALIDLLAELHSTASLGVLTPFLGSEDRLTQAAAERALASFGEDAIPFLLRVVDDSESSGRLQALNLLVSLKAPELVFQISEKTLWERRLVFLVKRVPLETLFTYLDEVFSPEQELRNLILRFKELYEAVKNYQETLLLIESHLHPYLGLYARWETTLLGAHRKQLQSAQLRREYLQTNSQSKLKQAREVWRESQKQSQEAARLHRKLETFDEQKKLSDAPFVERYLTVRRKIVQLWQTFSLERQRIAEQLLETVSIEELTDRDLLEF